MMKKHFQKLGLIIAVAIMCFFSCSKDEREKTPEVQDKPVLQENVKIIDAAKLELDLTPAKLENGVYEFTATGTVPSIKSGDIIVGEQGEGFLRKVSSTIVNGNTITLQTTQGNMSDLFKEGSFEFNLDMSNMTSKTSKTSNPTSSGFSYTIINKSVYQDGPLSIVLDNGQVDLNPNWFLDFSFNKNGITNFELSAKNGILNGSFTATVTASQATTLINKSSSILKNSEPFTKKFTKQVPATLLGLPVLVPITVVMQLDLVLDYSATVNAAISRQAIFTSNNTFNLGVNYANGQWDDTKSFAPINNFKLSQRTGNANSIIDLALTPKVSFKLYGLAGPYASISLMEQLSGSVASPALGWDFKADVWLKSTIGAQAAILKFSLANYSKSWETDKLSYLTPHKIEKVSGDNQVGTFENQLIQPLKVKVLDNLDKPQSNVPVYFAVSSGGGKLQTVSILTDSNGFAETLWTLGASGTQTVSVSAKKADGTALLNAPVSFIATATEAPCADTNTSYPTVTIGSQVWMQRNLNVCKYRNGDDIPQVQDPTKWAKLTTGAWCYYDNTTANGTVYGKLYNWYAVKDPRGLAPAGYHIPSDPEWTTLINFLGGNCSAIEKMKATTLWGSPNTGATNSSSFTGLPGGFRFTGGTFSSIGSVSFWWSSSEYDTESARWRRMGNICLETWWSGKREGYSVRCLKD